MSLLLVSCWIGLTGWSYAATIEIYPGTNVFGSAAQNLRAGDTLIVHQGTYYETLRTSIQAGGTPSKPILIKRADGEAKPIITRPSTASVENTITVKGATSYLTLQRLEIIGNGGDGINLNGNLSFITLEDLDIHDIDVGIGVHSSMNHLTIRKNHIHNTGRGGGTGEGLYVGCNNGTCIVSDSLIEGNWIHDALPGTTQGDGIEIKVGSHGNIIRDNVIYNRPYPGIFVYGTGGNAINVVEGNAVWNTLEGIYAVADALIRNNIIFDSNIGLSLYGHKQVSEVKNVTVVNNTLYNNDNGIYIRWDGAMANMVLVNNAIYSPGKSAVSSGGSIEGVVLSNYIEGAQDISIDHMKFFDGGSATAAFMNPGTHDFWPQATSPLVGSANSRFVPDLDFNNTPRMSPYDVGAYETHGRLTNPGWKIGRGFKQLTGPILAAPP